MEPVRIPGALPKPLGAPDDWTEENGKCRGLFIRPQMINGVHFMQSAWEASPEEAGLLLAGGKMVLGISGVQHPVVQLGVAELPEEFPPVVTARPVVDIVGNSGVQVDMLFAYGGGRRGVSRMALEGRGFATAVAEGIEQIEALARREGWIPA